MIQQLIDDNIIDEYDAQNHPHRHIVTSCLGVRRMQPKIGHITLTLAANESLLLCSDGSYKELTNSQIASIINPANNLNAAAQALIRHANLHGGSDNISVVLIAQC